MLWSRTSSVSCPKRAYRPATREELAAAIGEPPAELDGLLARGLDEARVETIGDHVYCALTLRLALQSIRRNCSAHEDVLDIPTLRDELSTSRKFLIPLLEYVDGTGLTRLRGGVRVLLPSSGICQQLAAES